jgi:hypothetical protein
MINEPIVGKEYKYNMPGHPEHGEIFIFQEHYPPGDGIFRNKKTNRLFLADLFTWQKLIIKK